MATILIVDDEISVIRALERILLYEKFKVDFTTRAKDSLEMINNNLYDIIICDQKMPDLSGIEVLEYARLTSPDTIRILLTAYADMNVLEDAINKSNIHCYCQKPWNSRVLVQTIKDNLQKKKIRDQIYVLFKDVMEHIEHLEEVLQKQQEAEACQHCRQNSSSNREEKIIKTDVIAVKKEDSIVLLNPSDIYYLVAAEGKVTIVTKDDRYTRWDPLKKWEDKLRSHGFFRCHRSFIVNINKIKYITPWFKDTYNIKFKDIPDEVYTSKAYISSLKDFINVN